MSTDLIARDYLAIERTRLANERTFLAYFRTFVVLLSSGFAILRLTALQELEFLGWILLVVAPILLIIGTTRLIVVRRRIKHFYEKAS
jgi:putative membrane protein